MTIHEQAYKLTEYLTNMESTLAARPVLVTIKDQQYNGAEYWQLRAWKDTSGKPAPYLQHMLYLLHNDKGLHYPTNAKPSRQPVYRLAEHELWYCASYSPDVISQEIAQFYPFGKFWQLSPARDMTYESLCINWRNQHSNRKIVDISIEPGFMQYGKQGTLDFYLDHDNQVFMVARDNRIKVHEHDIPASPGYLAMSPHAKTIQFYVTDYTKHDKLALWHCHLYMANKPGGDISPANVKRFIMAIRNSGSWLAIPAKYYEPEIHNHVDYTPVAIAVAHDNHGQHHDFYVYDNGKVTNISPADTIIVWRVWKGK